MQPQKEEFQEIAHCGGQVIFRIRTDAQGRRGYQITWQHSRPVAAELFALYALTQGIPVRTINLGGIGQPWDPPPFPGCFPVFISSDSEGKFGHQCPACKGYWRSQPFPSMCPYCRMPGDPLEFLTEAQRSYVKQYCSRLIEALEATDDDDHVVDMDSVAEAVGKDTPKPPFYYVEQSQQNQFICSACGEFNDILGTFGYCSICGTRNDLQELEEKTVPELRNRIHSGGPYEACVRDAVAAFDSFAGRYVTELLRIPTTPARRARLENMRFHNLSVVESEIKTAFDINILGDMHSSDVAFAALMFHRRNVYEHKSGEADEKYIHDSGDASVRPKQAIHETQESAHRLASIVVKMARKLHRGFHEIFPPEQGTIERHQKQTSPRTS